MASYFHGAPSPETTQAVEAWLKEDPANLRLFAEYAIVEDTLYAEQQSIDSHAVHTTVSEQDDSLTLDSRNSPVVLPYSIQEKEDDAMSGRELVYFAGSVLRKTFTSKRAVQAYATAAVLLLAAMLFFVFAGNDPSPDAPLAGQGTADELEPNTTSPSVLPVVATLTAEHDAVWDRHPGRDLHAGQRFTLTTGFAEITTKAGAVAILEAPVTIETLDSRNAIRLFDGKLVGICETDSSKGFTVRTPHMNVTDLGTRFGVDASLPDASEVHVLEGSVLVTRADHVDQSVRPSQRLITGQSARASKNDAEIVSIEYDANRFVTNPSDAQFNAPAVPAAEAGTSVSSSVSVDADGNITVQINDDSRTFQLVEGDLPAEIQKWAEGHGVELVVTGNSVSVKAVAGNAEGVPGLDLEKFKEEFERLK
jgi:ferric-dicitrate binding protein FerR (iron transport regulator)